ncbi:hypothetical protein BAUCODRAFT_39714 [Baudoinia panamericana UAMH 10762]|uniref:Uncharacterized protein n=1 Tax=Baudoinia panamericana (strain UAMH 10762) TaxID=717646 RepID=M2MXC6_BAUPA|nr:uncharacterized protein BAUCODRAFT_39714 [Baudoinia panamericana UAMH 10762]EMC90905.1 hypothetical protein BAUCODRAFT_39714 [Baudoinia panamericana UAMH 10762]
MRPSMDSSVGVWCIHRHKRPCHESCSDSQALQCALGYDTCLSEVVCVGKATGAAESLDAVKSNRIYLC